MDTSFVCRFKKVVVRWIFGCEVKHIKVCLITIILLSISQLRMSNTENDGGGGDCDTDLFSTVYYDVEEVKECVINAKTTQLFLRKQVKNGHSSWKTLSQSSKKQRLSCPVSNMNC